MIPAKLTAVSLVRRGGAAFSPVFPATLTGYVDSPFSFAALRAGGFLWQNTGKTIAAVADGDPIRVATCGAVDWTAPSDASRPLLYDETGGKWSASFDGADDLLYRTSTHIMAQGLSWSSFAGYRCAASSRGSVVGEEDSFTLGCGAGDQSGGGLNIIGYRVAIAWDSASLTHQSAGAMGVVATPSGSDTSITYYRNNVAGSTTTRNINTGNGTLLIGGEKLSINLAYPDRVSGAVFVSAAISSADRAALSTYLEAL